MAFVYFLMTILTAMLSLIAVRYVLFGAVWTTTGYSLWLFPNMMSEEVSHDGERMLSLNSLKACTDRCNSNIMSKVVRMFFT